MRLLNERASVSIKQEPTETERYNAYILKIKEEACGSKHQLVQYLNSRGRSRECGSGNETVGVINSLLLPKIYLMARTQIQ
ncbi:CLUMA_CG015518, isoform A [Clunio marinus]|uniref:CLUMA_CG015518, isoform A n=1 Tax=Clunio marinus TaxID=568069 RepID=A0A1J1IRC3_9DIPT|nr:CLUMA_CG015518, isoform A [Clunio marinus]